MHVTVWSAWYTADPEQDDRMTPEISAPDLLSNIDEDSGSKEDQGMENNDPSDKDETWTKCTCVEGNVSKSITLSTDLTSYTLTLAYLSIWIFLL